MLRFLSGAQWRAVALASAIFGAGVSAYLLIEYTTGRSGVCLTGAGCDLVRDSDFAYPLGVPLPLFGVVFYLVAAWVAWRTLPAATEIAGIAARTLLLLLAALGGLASLALTGIEAFVIGAFCTWCLAQAVASWILLLAAIGLAAQPPVDTTEARSSKARQAQARQLDEERQGMVRIVGTSSVLTFALFASLLGIGAVTSATPGASPGSNLVPADAPRIGTGPVTVVEFADFQCPGCAVVAPILQQLAAAGDVTLVARYYPLNQIHANADASARAAAAANLQGAYWPMSEQLYAQQAVWQDLGSSDADAYFASLAGALGLDVEQWRADYTSSAAASAIARDLDAARQLNLPGTPSILINGVYYDGSLSFDALRAAVARVLPSG